MVKDAAIGAEGLGILKYKVYTYSASSMETVESTDCSKGSVMVSEGSGVTDAIDL